MITDISDLLVTRLVQLDRFFIHCPEVGGVLRVGGSGLAAFLEQYPE